MRNFFGDEKLNQFFFFSQLALEARQYLLSFENLAALGLFLPIEIQKRSWVGRLVAAF